MSEYKQLFSIHYNIESGDFQWRIDTKEDINLHIIISMLESAKIDLIEDMKT